MPQIPPTLKNANYGHVRCLNGCRLRGEPLQVIGEAGLCMDCACRLVARQARRKFRQQHRGRPLVEELAAAVRALRHASLDVEYILRQHGPKVRERILHLAEKIHP